MGGIGRRSAGRSVRKCWFGGRHFAFFKMVFLSSLLVLSLRTCSVLQARDGMMGFAGEVIGRRREVACLTRSVIYLSVETSSSSSRVGIDAGGPSDPS